jgi:transmembrane sensor
LEDIKDIDALIAKYLSGEANPEEAMLLDDWKLARVENVNYFESYERIYYGQSLELNIDKNASWQHFKNEIIDEKSVTPLYTNRKYWLWAAMIIGVFGFSYLLIELNNDSTSFKSKDKSEIVYLADSSEIKIYPNASITIKKEYNQEKRLVVLNGSAHFSVIHDQSKPFLVQVSDLIIEDIGTRFEVLSSLKKDTITIAVTEGEVLVYNNKNVKQSITAGEKAQYIMPGNTLHFFAKPPIQNRADQTHSFDFNNTELKFVLEQIMQVYSVVVNVENSKVLNCKLTASFQNESLDNILMVVTETLGLRYKKLESNIFMIQGNTCKY